MIDLFFRAENLDLTHVGVFTGMLVLQNDDLNIDCIDIAFFSVVQKFCLQGHCVPSAGLLQLQVLNFLQILHIVASANRYFGWGV